MRTRRRASIVASGLFLAAVVIGFVAALAAFKAFEAAAFLPAEEFNRPYTRADRWTEATVSAPVTATILVRSGGLAAFLAYVHLVWD